MVNRRKRYLARKLAVITDSMGRATISRVAAEYQDFLGYDDSLDHLPPQRWLKALAGDRGFALRSNDLANLLTAARAGLGLVALPRVMARDAPDLISVPTPLPPPKRELWLLFHRDVGRTPAVRAVIDHITAIVRSAKAAFLRENVAGT